MNELPLSKSTRQLLADNQRALYIGRVRPETKEQFIEISEREFENDYGHFLDFLLSFWLNSKNLEEVNEKMSDLNKRLTELESRLGEERKILKSINGKIIERGGTCE